MRKVRWVLAFVGLLSGVLWFFSGESSDDLKIWIFFKDRPYSHLKTSSPVHFSADSIQRRKIRGLEPWSESDRPVESSYINQVRRAGAKISVVSRWLNAVSANCDLKCRSKLANLNFISNIRPVVSYIRPKNAEHRIKSDKQIRANHQTADLDYGPSKEQLEQMSVPAVHRKGFAGQGETVAIFSTGFMKDHLAFQGHEIVGEYDFVHQKVDCGSGNPLWLGTAAWSVVGGELPGQLYGPAFKSKVILAATDEDLKQSVTEEDYWVAAFEFADQMGASVINGTLGYADWYKASDYNGVTAIASKVASMAANKGIIVTSSIGSAGQFFLPSDAINILSVGLLDKNGIIVPYSFKGPTADGRIKPEVAARSLQVYKASTITFNQTTTFTSGNENVSLVAGAAAVLLSARPDWNALQIREALMKTASRANHPDNSYGHGIINLEKAIDYLPTNSVVIDHTPLKNVHGGQAIKVAARIRAQRGLNLNQLSLFWKKQSASTFQRIGFTQVPASQDSFQAFIPAQIKGTTISYYLSAKDIKGKSTRAPLGNGKTFQFKIL